MSNWGVQQVREGSRVAYRVIRTDKGHKESLGPFRNAAEARNVACYMNRRGQR